MHALTRAVIWLRAASRPMQRFLCIQALEPFYERFDNDFISLRTAAREILQREDDLNEIVQVRCRLQDN